MKNKIECPYCDGRAILQIESRGLSFRKEKFPVKAHYYRCQKCEEEFTTTDVDAVNILQLYNQYREKYNIPFPEGIQNLREKYGLSARKMSVILGLGINSYNNYEKGEVPSQANANLISMAKKPEALLSLLEKVKGNFSANAYDKLASKVKKAISEDSELDPFICAINYLNKPSRFTGYKTPDLNKIIGLLGMFLQNCKEEYNDRLKLNKLLFYSDFYNYKRTGTSITGITYRAIKYGPVPTYYDSIFAFLEGNYSLISDFIDDGRGGAREIFKSVKIPNEELFSKEELTTINKIINKFKDTPTWDVVNMSHQEEAWKKLNSENEIISYQDYAFDINDL